MKYYGLLLDGQHLLGVQGTSNKLESQGPPWLHQSFLAAEFVRQVGDTHRGDHSVPHHFYHPKRLVTVEVEFTPTPVPATTFPTPSWQTYAETQKNSIEYEILMEVNRELSPDQSFVLSPMERSHYLSHLIHEDSHAAVA